MTSCPAPAARHIKKYPNRRLYDTLASAYITLADVKGMVLARQPFAVVDARTGEDLTRSILLQILADEEGKGTPLLSTALLMQLIGYYGDAMQDVMGSYLEKNVQAFMDIQRIVADSTGADGNKTFTPEMWAQFMNMQGPMIQGMLSNYIEQSKTLFVQMQEQMQEQTKSLIDTFPFSQEEPS